MTDVRGKTFLIMAGGTGGHVFPALACAQELIRRGAQVHWLGSQKGMERELVGRAGLSMSLISVEGLRGKGKLALVLAPFKLSQAILQALAVVRRIRPDCVLGMGGFASGPGGFAAWLLRRPLVIHEQNAIAGYTNRILARLATKVLEAFPDSFGPGVATCVGNPVRVDIASLDEPERRLSARQGRVRLLVLGGSRGAAAINECLPQALALLPEEIRPEVIHQSGQGQLEKTQGAYVACGIGGDVRPFIDDMKAVYDWADLVVCRAGALTLAELCSVGLGAVLVPYPHAVDDHQTANARYLEANGAAVLMPQAQMTPQRLAEVLAELLGDRKRLVQMAQSARALAQPAATSAVVDYCVEAMNG